MENGEDNLERRFEGLNVSDPYNINGSDGLFQVMKAVEAAEATIKQQVLYQGFYGTVKYFQFKSFVA
ncbi:hypothetical protein CDL12_16314 [Handroanthus impetiginosus]|uniref:Uncharacterized protein n=1 Tax=Handroanthus impetiginosus TaxID=429701 RepID=A0A2G9H0P4_9LAMI|nr:hypothetical protein CDL12_16314 [Handroanthus impetiginosus]